MTQDTPTADTLTVEAMTAVRPNWAALDTHLWDIERVIPYAMNSRKHSATQIEQIARAISRWGFTFPLLIDEEGGLIAGHARLEAAKQLKLSQVPVALARGWSEEQKRAYVIADNKLAEASTWDVEKLEAELRSLTDLNFDTSLLGFSDADLKRLTANALENEESQISDDAADALPSGLPVKVSQVGDVWYLGRHRLVCGNSSDEAIVAAVMHDERAVMCFTSPPYASQRNYDEPVGDWLKMMCGVFAAAPLRIDGQILVNLGLVHNDGELVPYWNDWIAWMRAEKWRAFGWYVWDQGPGLPGDWVGRFAPSFEFIFHFNREKRKPNKFVPCIGAGEPHNPSGSMRAADGKVGTWGHAFKPTQETKIPDSVVRITRHKGGIGENFDHPAVFPVALPQFMYEAYSDRDEIVYEPFAGSGTSIIAAERAHRIARAVELSPAYCDLAVLRFASCFPDIDIHLEDGAHFDEVMQVRTGFKG